MMSKIKMKLVFEYGQWGGIYIKGNKQQVAQDLKRLEIDAIEDDTNWVRENNDEWVRVLITGEELERG